jgi:methionyl-tRNA formyltransferase
MEIGLLVSGDLGFVVTKKLLNVYKINFILCDKMSESIINLAIENNIPYFAGNPRNGRAINKLEKIQCDLIISVNYLFIIENDIIQIPSKFAINFHGSLLPKYRGRTPHVWAIINNETETGITAHIIDENCDTGDILNQVNIIIERNDTGGVLLGKFMNIYPGFVIETIKSIEKNNFNLRKQDNKKATYFGKRTKDDGKINWNWQKERIENWVRAQAKPYPGAFSFINGEKIIIHKIEFDSLGYNHTDINGTILKIINNFPIIKSPNGCIKILEFEYEKIFKKSDVLE